MGKGHADEMLPFVTAHSQDFKKRDLGANVGKMAASLYPIESDLML